MKTIILEIEDENEIAEIMKILKPFNVKIKSGIQEDLSHKLKLLEKSKGTIKVPWTITDEALRRENMYDDIDL